jgi:hypothetical protein
VSDLRAQLAGSDLRSIGRSNEVAAQVLAEPELFGQLIDGMTDPDPVIRMRSSDATEKVTAQRPDLLAPYRERLLGPIAAQEQQEVRWHVAQMLPRLELTARQRDRAVALLEGYLDDDSRIVRVEAMQALADLARAHAELRPAVRPLLERLTETGTPAMRARGRKLLAALDRSA